MIDLVAVLAQRSHRDLELTARAHNLDFTRREAKVQGLAELTAALQAGVYPKAFQALGAKEKEALQALVRAGGALPIPLFSYYFGQIRPYRPWRKDFTPRHPWRYPISAAEKLYQQAFIHLEEEMVYIVNEAAAMLTQPQVESLPRPFEFSLPLHQADRWALLRDLAALIGLLPQVETQAIHGHWFHLKSIRQMNAAFLAPEALGNCRSELQTGRFRFLHYLAQVAGLITLQTGRFQSSLSAWDWLTAPAEAQWETLMQAIERDLARRERLWDTFRFPEIDHFSWQVLRHTLDELNPAYSYCVKAVLGMLKPYLLAQSSYELAKVLQSIGQWSGILLLKRGRIFIHQHDFRKIPQNSRPQILLEAHALRLKLPAVPAFAPFSRLLNFAQVQGHDLLITEAAIRQALRQGFDQQAVLDLLSHFCIVSPAIQKRIQDYFLAASRLSLQSMLILASSEPELLAEIQSDWRLRSTFLSKLSPQHLAIKADSAEKLIQKLERRDYALNHPLITPAPMQDSELSPAMAEYLLLAVRSYQKIDSRLGAANHIPNSVVEWLQNRVPNYAAIEAQANQVAATVQKNVPQAAPIQADAIQDSASLRRELEFSRARGTSISIDYYSPHSGETTSRRVHVQEIYEANTVTYFEAYCELAGEVRTFRLDRILRIVENLDKSNQFHDLEFVLNENQLAYQE